MEQLLWITLKSMFFVSLKHIVASTLKKKKKSQNSFCENTSHLDLFYGEFVSKAL